MRLLKHKSLFDTLRDAGEDPLLVHTERGLNGDIITEWCVYGLRDDRDHPYCLQWVKGDARGIMVRAGCRFMKLDMVEEHWRKRALKGDNYGASGAQALSIISLMLSRARREGLPGIKHQMVPTLKRKPNAR